MSTSVAADHCSGDLYDPDEDVLPRNSPMLEAHRPRLRLSPKPSALFPQTRACDALGYRRPTVQSSQADTVLVRFLGNGKDEDTARRAGEQTLPSGSDSEGSTMSEDYSESSQTRLTIRYPQGDGYASHEPPGPLAGDKISGIELLKKSLESSRVSDTDTLDLKSLAAGALAVSAPSAKPLPNPRTPLVDAGPTPPMTEQDVVRERQVSIFLATTTAPQGSFIRKDRPEPIPVTTAASPFSLHSLCSPREASRVALPKTSPTNTLSPPVGLTEGSLPPIVNSPRSDGGSTPLPSIRSLCMDLDTFSHTHAYKMERERGMRPGQYTHSPPANRTRLPPLHHSRDSPPLSPDFRSPRHPLMSAVTSPRYFYGQAGGQYGRGLAETPRSAEAASMPATSEAADRMRLDTAPAPIHSGAFVCRHPGCNAQPFQTQYLLNSHANVHSQSRPHFCPVKGCPRAEGGRGFKRKNEMIRHGLVHESPGYICPFCLPDREHRYPRPDNLQRHVRVHHPDRDKEDPLLRDVLAQRPDGPNRGRRRRMGGT